MRFAQYPASAMRAAALLGVTVLGLPVLTSCTSPPALPTPRSGFTTMLGPVTGTGSKTFTMTAPTALSYTLNCQGSSLVWIRTTPDIVGFAVQCPATGGDALDTPKNDIGRRIRVRVAAPSGTTWQLRIDRSSARSKAALPSP